MSIPGIFSIAGLHREIPTLPLNPAYPERKSVSKIIHCNWHIQYQRLMGAQNKSSNISATFSRSSSTAYWLMACRDPFFLSSKFNMRRRSMIRSHHKQCLIDLQFLFRRVCALLCKSVRYVPCVHSDNRCVCPYFPRVDLGAVRGVRCHKGLNLHQSMVVVLPLSVVPLPKVRWLHRQL